MPGQLGQLLAAFDVAIAVARKLCAELVVREPLGEIMALVAVIIVRAVSASERIALIIVIWPAKLR